MYKYYINNGVISTTLDNGKKVIDTSELVRVFSKLQPLDSTRLRQPVNTEVTPVDSVKLLEAQLAEMRETIRHERQQNEQLTAQINKLIESNNMLLLQQQPTITPATPVDITTSTPKSKSSKRKINTSTNITFADILAKWDKAQAELEQAKAMVAPSNQQANDDEIIAKR